MHRVETQHDFEYMNQNMTIKWDVPESQQMDDQEQSLVSSGGPSEAQDCGEGKLGGIQAEIPWLDPISWVLWSKPDLNLLG